MISQQQALLFRFKEHLWSPNPSSVGVPYVDFEYYQVSNREAKDVREIG